MPKSGLQAVIFFSSLLPLQYLKVYFCKESVKDNKLLASVTAPIAE